MTAVRTASPSSRRLASVPAGARSASPARPRLTVASPPASRTNSRALLFVAVVGIVAAIAVVMVSQTLLVGSQGRLDGVQRQIQDQQEILERQRLTLAQLQSPERVVSAATERLGMVVPEGIVYLPGTPQADELIAEEPAPPPGPTDSPEGEG